MTYDDEIEQDKEDLATRIEIAVSEWKAAIGDNRSQSRQRWIMHEVFDQLFRDVECEMEDNGEWC